MCSDESMLAKLNSRLRLPHHRPDPVTVPTPADRAVVDVRGRAITFAIDNPDDLVQRVLTRGRVYEAHLLSSHADLIYRGCTVLDIGSNVGNHAVYYARCGARRVYAFEPNPRANRLLRTTVSINDLERIDLTHADLAIGARPGELFVDTPVASNLGKTRMVAEGVATSEVKVHVARIDDLTLDGRIAFVKVDVEGMELDVLEGAAETIARHRPALGIEVDNENIGRFWDWAEEHRYHVVRAVRDYPANINYVCVPKG